MIRRMLVPLDGSVLAESILPAVEALARLTGASLTLMQAVVPPDPLLELAEFRDYRGVELAIQEAEEKAAHTYLTRIADRLGRQGLVVHTRVVLGEPAELIVQLARAFDLVAMATHGRGGIGRWVYGSVADKVLRAAPVPVLVVRPTVPVEADEPVGVVAAAQ
jgi:nucleotide-binding universal stress UspA family protein